MGSCGFPMRFYCPSEWLEVVDVRCIYETDMYVQRTLPLNMFIINSISMYVSMKLLYFKHKNLHTFVVLGIVHRGSQSVPGFSFVLLWVTACPGSPNTNNQWDTDVCFHLVGKNLPRSESGLYLVRVEKTGVGAFVSQTHSLIYVMSSHSDLTTPTLPPLQMQQ